MFLNVIQNINSVKNIYFVNLTTLYLINILFVFKILNNKDFKKDKFYNNVLPYKQLRLTKNLIAYKILIKIHNWTDTTKLIASFRFNSF